MKKRLQVVFSEEAWKAVESLTEEANQNFENGSINYSDAINEMILCAKVDVRSLQLKHTNLRKSLRSLASKSDLDIDAAIKMLTEIKAKIPKRSQKFATSAEGNA